MSVHRQASAGFTLVELVVTITISIIMSAVIMGFMASSMRASAIATAKADLLREAQQGLDGAADDIRLSSNADINNRWPDSNGPTPGDLYSWTSGGSTLVLSTPAQDSSHNIIFADASHYITEKNNTIYFVSGGTLYRRILASTVSGNAAKTTCPAILATSACPADRAVLHNVSAFSVSYRDGSDSNVAPVDARSIILNVTLNARKYNQDFTTSYNTRMVFRND